MAGHGRGPTVTLHLSRTSRPCTSQCAPFGNGGHLRWQSEPGVRATGSWTTGDGSLNAPPESMETMLGYHERVRGRWSWPELGGWVFGFANDAAESGQAATAPPAAVVFTLLQPTAPSDATNGSVMLWRRGRLLRHFPRRSLQVAVQGLLDRDRVVLVPPLAGMLGTPPAAPVPRRLLITGICGQDRVRLDFHARTAARIANPSETTLRPFSVHEVLGDCRVEAVVSGRSLAFEAGAVVEFAGGAR
ncbi:hypothetical protein [Streptomyces spinoverrucosus]|uniref:hypothetical protein n=1 Tax=Streptomyces spinoverrucosus TaxID=284043 RepID=UPI001E4ED445|nr:hypothetical protein [Streptomyces spinoverrucosus]